MTRRGRHWVPSALSALAFLLLAACGVEDRIGTEWTGTVDTLSSGAVLVGNPTEGVWDEGGAWHLEEDLRIGAHEGDGPEVFGQIVDVTTDAYGRIHVADIQAGEIRVFDSDGSFVRTMGRSGQGPGEFRNLAGLGWGAEGHLWAVDQGNARYSVFDTTGTFRTSHRRGIAGFGPWPGAIDREGRVYEVIPGRVGGVVVRLGANLASADTLPLPAYEEDRLEIASGNRVMSMSIPFVPSLRWSLDPRGLLWAGITDRYRLHQIDFEGDTLRIVDLEHDPVRVSATEREEALALFSSGRIDPSRIPSLKPAFDRIHVDDRDHLWVIPHVAGEEPGRFADIFDPEGRYLGRLALPFSLPQFPVRFRDGYLYTVTTDDVGVPYVVRLRILRDAG